MAAIRKLIVWMLCLSIFGVDMSAGAASGRPSPRPLVDFTEQALNPSPTSPHMALQQAAELKVLNMAPVHVKRLRHSMLSIGRSLVFNAGMVLAAFGLAHSAPAQDLKSTAPGADINWKALTAGDRTEAEARLIDAVQTFYQSQGFTIKRKNILIRSIAGQSLEGGPVDIGAQVEVSKSGPVLTLNEALWLAPGNAKYVNAHVMELMLKHEETHLRIHAKNEVAAKKSLSTMGVSRSRRKWVGAQILYALTAIEEIDAYNDSLQWYAARYPNTLGSGMVAGFKRAAKHNLKVYDDALAELTPKERAAFHRLFPNDPVFYFPPQLIREASRQSSKINPSLGFPQRLFTAG